MSSSNLRYDRPPSFSDAEVKGIAEKILAVLDLQRRYFKDHDRTVFKQSLQAEAELRLMAKNVIAIIELGHGGEQPRLPATLFDNGRLPLPPD